jgi:hypothetical protein
MQAAVSVRHLVIKMATILQTLDQKNLDYEYMDDDRQQLVINHPIHSVAAALAGDNWEIQEQRAGIGGMYTVSIVNILQRGDLRIKLISSTLFRTTLWKA